MSNPTLPIKLKASGQAKIKVIAFLPATVLCLFCLPSLVINDLELGLAVQLIGILLFVLLLASGCQVLCVLIPMLAGKRPAAIITERGIESTYIQVKVLTLPFLLPVKIIPWSAVKLLSNLPEGTADLSFEIDGSRLPDHCGSPAVKRALKREEQYYTLSITFHAAMTPEEAELARSLASK